MVGDGASTSRVYLRKDLAAQYDWTPHPSASGCHLLPQEKANERLPLEGKLPQSG